MQKSPQGAETKEIYLEIILNDTEAAETNQHQKKGRWGERYLALNQTTNACHFRSRSSFYLLAALSTSKKLRIFISQVYKE